MYRIKGRIEGVAPFLFNGWTKAALEALDPSRPKHGGRRTPESYEDEVKEKVHRGNNGNLVLPADMIQPCFIQGIRMAGIKEGKASMAPYVKATAFFEHDIDLGKKEPDFIHEKPGNRPPGPKGGGCLIKRPAFNIGWGGEFTIVVTDDRRHPDNLRRGLEEAGLLVGVGSWRPLYGRFIVTKWEVIESGK